jgi:hypothetical protein
MVRGRALVALLALVAIGCGSKEDGEIPDVNKASQNPETNTMPVSGANQGAPATGTSGQQRKFGLPGR